MHHGKPYICLEENGKTEDSSVINNIKTERSLYLVRVNASRDFNIQRIDLVFESVNCAASVLSPGCFYLILNSKCVVLSYL